MDQPRELPLLLLVMVWDVLAHGFCEAVALAAPGQLSCILTQCQDPVACTQSPLLPCFVHVTAVTLELTLEFFSASEKWN